jgi:alkyl hydroperoxide reductase subunit AhpC
MAIRIGDVAPDFSADTTLGPIRFHEWMGDRWTILFSHPRDFTPVCTTELGYLASLMHAFEKRRTRVIGLSADTVDEHRRWMADIEKIQGQPVTYPLIGDPDLRIAKLYQMLPASANGDHRTEADNATVRSVFVIGPDKTVKAMLVYPVNTGRNFDEVLRLLDSLQLTATHPVSTPVNWKPGEDVIIPAALSDAEAIQQYPDGLRTYAPYLRTVRMPDQRQL